MNSPKLLQMEDAINRFIETGMDLIKSGTELDNGWTEEDREQFSAVMQIIKLCTLSKAAMEEIAESLGLNLEGDE